MAKDAVLGEFGGGQFSAFKSALVELSVEKLGPIGAEMKRLVAAPDAIDAILRSGGERAEAIAAKNMAEVKDILGFVGR
jgi:tryptophanyl-tRNA synthetase